MVELVDTLALGASAKAFGFESQYPYYMKLGEDFIDFVSSVDVL